MKNSKSNVNDSMILKEQKKLKKPRASADKSTLPNSPSHSSSGKGGIESEFFINYWKNLPDSTSNETIKVPHEDEASNFSTTNTKHKTEMCKNWETNGTCKFGDKCSFAHGLNELREKCHLNSNFKTKPCRSYFLQSYCNYGNRCQYLHLDLIYERQHKPFLLKSYKDNGFSKSRIKKVENFVTYGEQLDFWLDSKSSQYSFLNCNSMKKNCYD